MTRLMTIATTSSHRRAATKARALVLAALFAGACSGATPVGDAGLVDGAVIDAGGGGGDGGGGPDMGGALGVRFRLVDDPCISTFVPMVAAPKMGDSHEGIA